MLDKKHIWTVFLFEFKMEFVEQWRQLETSAMHLARELLMNRRAVVVLRSFCEGDESLEDEEYSHQPSEVGSSSEPSPKLVFLNLWEKGAGKLDCSTIILHLK